MRTGLAVLVTLAGALPLSAAASPASLEVPLVVRTSENVIRITPRYEGDLVKVWGTAPGDCNVVVTLTGERGTVFCSRKGKVGGVWLSVGRVRFDGVPPMYKVTSAAPIDDTVRADDQVRYAIGRRGLKASITVESDADRDLYLNELIHILERDRLFSFRQGAVERQGDAFRTAFFWPPDGPPGRYRIDAYAVRNGLVVGSAQAWVEVRAVGVEAWVRDLARRHGILYGLFAVGLAMVAGLAASFAFARRPRRPHSETTAS